jgi:glycosyltransferase involved in cell wall biosynthesis
MTFVDILLPFYGDVGYLKLAVESVLAQGDPDWRLIVVDDGYPDRSVAEWFARLDHPQVQYSRNVENLGANGNYVHALTKAEATWVVVMGADDVMLPSYVATVRELVAAFPLAGVVQPGVQVIDSQGHHVRPLADTVKRALRPRSEEPVELCGERLSAALLRANWTYFPSLCWRREVIASIGFRPGLNVVQDLALLLDVAASGRSMVLASQPAFLYRRHQGSDSALRAATGSRFDEERAFFRTMVEESQARGWSGAARAARWHVTSRLNAASFLPTAVRARNWAATRSLLHHALRA